MKPLAKFRQHFPKYVEDSITTLETKLMVAAYVKDKDTIRMMNECAV